MYVLDTDHMTFLQRTDAPEGKRLIARIASASIGDVVTSVITYEEQMRGWLAYLARARTMSAEIAAYERLRQHVEDYKAVPMLSFDDLAAVEFQRLRKLRVRVGTLDLKIAAIALARGATLLSRTAIDFSRIPELRIENWTV